MTLAVCLLDLFGSGRHAGLRIKNKPEDFIKMTPFVKSRDIPDQLILQMKQIHYLSVIKLNVYVFHKGEIREYGK